MIVHLLISIPVENCEVFHHAGVKSVGLVGVGCADIDHIRYTVPFPSVRLIDPTRGEVVSYHFRDIGTTLNR